MHLAIVVLFLFFSTVLAQTSTICPEEWTYVEKAQRCYKTVPESLNWSDARLACQRLNATLPSVFDQQTDDALRGFAFGRISSIGIFHLGLRYTYKPPATTGEWLWPDGSKANFTNWDGGRAEIAFGNCAQASLSEHNKGHWSPTDCNSVNRSAICELPPWSSLRAALRDEGSPGGGSTSGGSNDGNGNETSITSRPTGGKNGSKGGRGSKRGGKGTVVVVIGSH